MAIVEIDSVSYKTENEVIKAIKITPPTFYTWVKKGIIKPPERFNYRGWRLYTDEEIAELILSINRTFNKRDGVNKTKG